MPDRPLRGSVATGRSRRRRVALVAVAALSLAGCGSGGAPAPADTSPTVTVSPAPAPAVGAAPTTQERSEPTRVVIPSLDLDENLIELGLDPAGTLEVPKDPDRVGWFSGGGRPGGPGATVLAGHVDSATGPAVFARLTELRPGDRLMVDNADGDRVAYVVDKVADFAKATFPTEDVFGSTPDDQLRLITCTGEWDRDKRSHLDNRIVFASPA